MEAPRLDPAALATAAAAKLGNPAAAAAAAAALSSGPITSWKPRHPFFFLDFDDSFRLRVWMPSFFIVKGRFTYNSFNSFNSSIHYHLIYSFIHINSVDKWQLVNNRKNLNNIGSFHSFIYLLSFINYYLSHIFILIQLINDNWIVKFELNWIANNRKNLNIIGSFH